MSADQSDQPFRQPMHPDDAPPAPQPEARHQHGPQGPGGTAVHAPQAPPMPHPLKDTTAAWLLLIFLGGLGAHDFYLRSTGPAVTKLIVFLISAPLTFIFIGYIPLLGIFIWNVVDAFRMGDRLRDVNTKIWQQNVGAQH